MAKRKKQREQSLRWSAGDSESYGLDWYAVNIELTIQKTRDFYVFTQALGERQSTVLTEDARKLLNRLMEIPGIMLVAINTYELWVEVSQAFDLIDEVIDEIQRCIFTRETDDIEEMVDRPHLPFSIDLQRNSIVVQNNSTVSLDKA